VIYFVACPEANAVKIGICWDNLNQLYSRLSTLQTSCPLRLNLLAVERDGHREEEAVLHGRFAHLRIHGEWFRLADELLEFVSSLQPPPEKPTSRSHSNHKRRQWFEESRAA
jgi:hypothetical protein